ncbi:RrF2 family transcriptional regulator [Spirochaetota bacterium]
MHLSTFARYGLRSIIRLAVQHTQGKEIVSISAIAKHENISIKYLEAIFAILKKNNMISAVRGKKGGYRIKKKYDAITALNIVESLDGEIGPVDCVIDKKSCKNKPSECVVYPLWVELNKKMRQVLMSKTLADFIKDFKKIK